MANPTPGRIQGDDLVTEVLRNMEEGLFCIRQKTIVPAVYRIYLHPSDFEPMRDIAPFIATEIRTALDDRLASWNSPRRRLLARIGLGGEAGPSEFVRAAEDWLVEIHPDLDGKLAPGEIEVYSDLGSPQRTETTAGSLTRRIFPQPAGPQPAGPQPAEPQPAEPQGSEALPLVPPIPAEPVAETAPVPHPEPQPVNSTSSEEVDGTKPRAFAYIRYADQRGQQTFEVTKLQTVIGRGGRSYWVDLKLETEPDVSREHCRIRRDEQTDRFTIEDLSQFGTAVNGKPVEKNAVSELPRRAVISLAGVIDLTWEAA